ncbi:uncharacterized protein LOC134516715 [Chroicocephalus ridibundus]|uniref:uncharacterized protein LOC134516715 n=1 Tax=Chroicocephalus ridibundus TaxID=1192867 RepID=UPI002FDC974F
MVSVPYFPHTEYLEIHPTAPPSPPVPPSHLRSAGGAESAEVSSAPAAPGVALGGGGGGGGAELGRHRGGRPACPAAEAPPPRLRVLCARRSCPPCPPPCLPPSARSPSPPGCWHRAALSHDAGAARPCPAPRAGGYARETEEMRRSSERRQLTWTGNGGEQPCGHFPEMLSETWKTLVSISEKHHSTPSDKLYKQPPVLEANLWG